MDMSRGYEIKPATNGGFIVRDANNPMQPGAYRDDIAAFSNATDLIAWLAKQHDVPFGGFDVSPEHVEVMKAAIAGERTPIYDELCEDEGCDHHGILVAV